jgi:hypothetical protein
MPQCSADENFGIDFTGYGIFRFVEAASAAQQEMSCHQSFASLRKID